MENKRKIEIFTAGCPLCVETVEAVRQAVAGCGCEVIEHDISSQISHQAKQYGIKAVPTVVIDGQIAFERRPTDQEIATLHFNHEALRAHEKEGSESYDAG